MRPFFYRAVRELFVYTYICSAISELLALVYDASDLARSIAAGPRQRAPFFHALQKKIILKEPVIVRCSG